MGDPGQTHSGTAAPQRPTRTALEEPACGLECHFVGVTDGCSVGGCSGALPAIPDLPSQISAMGSVWNDERSSGSPCHRTKGPRGPGCKRSLHRWELCSSEKGGSKVGKTKRGKGTKIMAVADRHGLPVSVCVESATPHEVKLATSTLVQMIVSEAPQNLIGDKAYDSDKLDTELRRYGIELIAPHRSNRRNTSQDLRRIRRYRRRWKIERLFAWLQNFRRLVVRYERYAENFLGMLYLGCCIILLRHL
jgi:transposase